MRNPTWYGILLACRVICPTGKEPFTAEMLAQEADIKSTRATPALQIASAWLAKFVKWNYVSREEERIKRQGRGRPWTTYLITDKGMTCEQMEGRVSRLSRLIASVLAFRAARGTSKESALFAELMRICDEVDPALKKRGS